MDSLSPDERSKRMGRVRSKDTKPEWVVRRLVHAMGYRYRLHGKGLPGRPDLVFRKRRKVIFIHGCFWHRHSSTCPLTRMPKSRIDFWEAEFEGNRRRDAANQEKLRESGWDFLIVWECQLRDLEGLAQTLRDYLD